MMIDEAFDEQNKLAQKFREFKSNAKAKNPTMRKEQSDVINNLVNFLREEKYFIMVLRVEYCPYQINQ